MSKKNMIKGILFLAIACMIFVAGQRKSNNIIQQNLKSNLIRFHVRANSNSRMDQTYKLKVRDAVIDQISPELSEAKTKEEAFKILKMQKNRNWRGGMRREKIWMVNILPGLLMKHG